MRPRAAARSPMRGASQPATKAGGCTDERARPWSRRSPRASGFGRWRALRYPKLERERIAPCRPGFLIATFRCVAPARCGAFADERRIVAGDEGGRA